MWLKKFRNFVNNMHLEQVRVAAYQVLGGGTQISVSEINCPEPGCPPTKTVIVIFREGRSSTSLTIHKPAAQVTAVDIERATRAAA